MVARRCLVAVIMTLGCAPQPVRSSISLDEPLPGPIPTILPDSAEYLPFRRAGIASLSGQVFLLTREQGTRVVDSCELLLDPVTTYSKAWMRERGTSASYFGDIFAEPSIFENSRRRTTADASGRFMFRDLPEGTFYLRALIPNQKGKHDGVQLRVVDVVAGKPSMIVITAIEE